MDFSSLLSVMIGLTYIGVVVYLANLVEAAPQPSESTGWMMDWSQASLLRWLLYGIIGLTFLFGFMVIQLALFSDLATQIAEENPTLEPMTVNTGWAVATFVLAGAATVLSLRLVSSEKARERLSQIIGTRGAYNPRSNVHTAAIVLMLLVTVYAFFSLVFPSDAQVDIGDVLFQAVLQVVIALLGVGLAIRRNVPQALERLGLRVPTRADLTWGVGIGVLFFVLSRIVIVIWMALTSPETFEQQTAAGENLVQSFNTLPLAFLLSAGAAIGEEIWIRGALQPVFGIVITSVFFTVLHTQYALTPATLIIFVFALGLGWLRQRHSTSAAIIAHFTYNFIPFALAFLLGIQ